MVALMKSKRNQGLLLPSIALHYIEATLAITRIVILAQASIQTGNIFVVVAIKPPSVTI